MQEDPKKRKNLFASALHINKHKDGDELKQQKKQLEKVPQLRIV
jgi:hypothetical protein